MATDDRTPPPPAAAPVPSYELGTEAGSFLTPQRIKVAGIALAVVAVAAAGIWFTNASAERKEVFAAQALEQARATAEQGDIGQAVQQFEQVTAQYGGTPASHEATIGIAQARLVSGQAELAIASLRDYLATNPPDNYASPAQGLLGTALENTGRYADAEAAYRVAAEKAGVDYLKATLLLDAGRAARLAGREEEAREIYNRIVADFGETAARTEAEVRLGEMMGGA